MRSRSRGNMPTGASWNQGFDDGPVATSGVHAFVAGEYLAPVESYVL